MNNQIKYLIDRYYQVQKQRIAVGNEVAALEKDGQDTTLLAKYHEDFLLIEKEILRDIKKELKSHPMWEWLEGVKGIGPVLAAALLTMIDIERAEHAASVWKYAGLAVTPEGRSERRERGKKLEYNPFLKTICWKIGESFVKSKGEYRQVYDTSKLFYQNKFPKEVKEGNRTLYTKGHIHAMAKRRAVKLFLADFWAAWRTAEGLEVSVPFAHRGEDKDPRSFYRIEKRESAILGKKAK